MKYGIISDIHGNSIGLKAVIEATEALGGVDSWLVLGDLCAIGPDPIAVIESLQKLPNAHIIKGNTDHYIANNYRDYPPPSIEQALHDAAKIANLAEVSRSFSWTQGMITAAGYFDWIAALPLEIRLTLPDGTKLLLVHARPKHFDGWGMAVLDSDELVAENFACDDDLILVGHVHWPQERRVAGKHIFNPGPVGNKVGEHVVAHYGILKADESGYEISHHEAEYDTQAVLAQIEAVHNPTPEFVSKFYRSNFFPNWYKEVLAQQ